MSEIRVAIVDDHTAFREGLEGVLHGRQGVEIVGSFADAETALAGLSDLVPDVVLMDLSLPGLGGLAATARIVAHHPGVRVVVLSMHDDTVSVREAIEAGAKGYLAKTSGLDEILRGIHAVRDGQLLLGSTVSTHLTGHGTSTAHSARFTAREREVLRLLADAATTGQIAERLGLAQKTVRNILSALYLKLGVEDRGQAVLAARQLRL